MSDSPAPARTREQDLAWTGYLRVAAMAAVVAIHVAGMTYVKSPTHSGATFWLAAVLNYSTKWAVPVFVMVSGLLSLRPPADADPMAFFRRRLGRIGVPLVFWHAVYLAVSETRAPVLTWRMHLAKLLQGQTYTALYFFWLILGLYLVTPLLWPIVRSWSPRALVVAASVLTLLPAADLDLRLLVAHLSKTPPVDADPTIVVLFLPYLGFYLLGYALRDVVVTGARKVLVVAVAVASMAAIPWQVVVAPGLGRPWSTMLSVFSPITYQGPLLAVCAVSVFLAAHALIGPGSPLASPAAARRIRALGDLTLGVFAVHMLLIYLYYRAQGAPQPLWPTTVPALLGQTVGFTIASFAVTKLLMLVPGLRRVVGG